MDSIWSFPAGGIYVTASDVGADGFAAASQRSVIPLSMTRQDIRSLVDAKFIKLEMALNTPADRASVKFRSSDKIMIRLFGNLSYRVSED